MLRFARTTDPRVLTARQTAAPIGSIAMRTWRGGGVQERAALGSVARGARLSPCLYISDTHTQPHTHCTSDTHHTHTHTHTHTQSYTQTYTHTTEPQIHRHLYLKGCLPEWKVLSHFPTLLGS